MNRILVIVSLLSFMFFGCNQGNVRKSLLPGVSGQAGEVLVIMEKESWNGGPGEAVKDVFLENVPGLPQTEPLLNVVNISNRAFSELFRIHRNVVITKISSSVNKPKITIGHDKWAQPQTVINIVAPSRESFIKLFNEKGEKVLSAIIQSERKRLMANYTKYAEPGVIKRLERNTGIHLTIPKGYTYDLDTNNFVWISHETPQISQGLFVYYYDYNDTTEFSKINLLNKRNEYLQKYVAGARKGSYMTTELQFMPNYNSFQWQGKYTAELRGLWKVEGDYMGGPFVSISQLDSERGRIVTVEGYVYAPKFNKRNYMRQLEAILYSLDFVTEEESKK